MYIRANNQIYDTEKILEHCKERYDDARFVECDSSYSVLTKDKILWGVDKKFVDKIGEKIEKVVLDGDLVRFGNGYLMENNFHDIVGLSMLKQGLEELYVKNCENGYNLVYKDGKIL